jgi:hypothetical protein
VQNGQALPGASYGATAGDDGKFVIEEIEPGASYQLSAQRPGFVPARYGARGNNAGGAPIPLEPGQLLRGLTIQMTPQGVLSGRVADAASDPVQNVAVTILRRGYQRGVRQMVTVNPEGGMQNNGVGMFTADQRGGFRFAGLRPGVYYLAAWDDIGNGLAQARDFLNLLTSEATRIELAEGSAASADVTLAPVAKIKAAEERLP